MALNFADGPEVNVMNNLRKNVGSRRLGGALILAATVAFPGCAPNYRDFRREGQAAVLRNDYGPAQYMFSQAERKKPRRVANLHDLAVCHVMLARQKFEQMNSAAAFRELDHAIAYYRRAIDAAPGHQASLEGLNIALELKGQFDEALRQAQWAADFVGPSAKQQIFLAQELEQRGDDDGALLRYRQAVAMEPRIAMPHIAIAKFLMRHDNDSAAVDHLQIAYRLDPTDRWVVEELAVRSAIPQLATATSSTP